MAVARSTSGGIVICYVLPSINSSYLSSSVDDVIFAHKPGLLDMGTRSLGLGYKLCAVIPVAAEIKIIIILINTESVFVSL